MPKPDGTYKYQDAVNSVNARGDGSKAFLTVKREMENYLHADALTETFAACAPNPVVVNITDDCDVEQEVANQLGCGKVQRRAIKSWLSQEAADRMTIARLDARNGKVEIVGWLTEIASHL
jgi:hypothetical protein